MLTPVRRDLLKWETPDPSSDWLMIGHILVRDSGCVLVDPPHIPGLLNSVSRLGKIEGVIVTTLDHSRGAALIVRKTGARLLLPDQSSDDVDPLALRIKEEITDYEEYNGGKVLGLEAFRLSVPGKNEIGMPSMNEFALLTEHKELFTGDLVIGSAEGKMQVAPEWFPSEVTSPAYELAHSKVKDLIHKTGAVSLLPSHGSDILNVLQKAAEFL